MLGLLENNAAYTVDIPGGNAGVKETLKIMRGVAREYRRNPAILALVRDLLSTVPQKSWQAEVNALHEFVRDRIRYTLDTNGVEVLQTPGKLLETMQGDCDDKATLLATLLEASGHPARFVAVGFDGVNLSHVLVDTKIGDKWLPLETTEPVAPGWFPPGVNLTYVVNI